MHLARKENHLESKRWIRILQFLRRFTLNFVNWATFWRIIWRALKLVSLDGTKIKANQVELSWIFVESMITDWYLLDLNGLGANLGKYFPSNWLAKRNKVAMEMSGNNAHFAGQDWIIIQRDFNLNSQVFLAIFLLQVLKDCCSKDTFLHFMKQRFNF